MALLGYCRVSTDRQSLDQQIDALTLSGVEKIFTDKRSGAREDRYGLAELLAYARAGDTIVVWRLDRLGRSLSHIVRTVADLQGRGIYLRAIQDGADSSTSTGRMMIGILASLAEYERELIAERSAAAREAARDRGRQVGRPTALSEDQARQVRALTLVVSPSPIWSRPSGSPGPRSTGRLPKTARRGPHDQCSWTTSSPASASAVPEPFERDEHGLPVVIEDDPCLSRRC